MPLLPVAPEDNKCLFFDADFVAGEPQNLYGCYFLEIAAVFCL